MSKKTMIIVAGSVVGLIIALLLVVWLISIFRTKYFSYEEVRDKIITASESYYKTHPEMLPTEDGKYTLQYSALVNEGFIKPLNELLKDGNDCTAEIYVYKDEDNYDYVPKLACGNNYRNVELYQKVLDANPVVEFGSGLHTNTAEDGTITEYYFRGKVKNNYVRLGYIKDINNEQQPMLWRILSIDKDGVMKIISTEPYANKMVYDNRYNENDKLFNGYNDFENSVLKSMLVKISNNESFLSTKQKSKLVKKPVCYGNRRGADETKDGSIECSKKSEPLYFGTITPYEWMRISLDENCVNQRDLSCTNFNFLYGTLGTSWTTIATDLYTDKAFIFNGASFELKMTNSSYSIYPTAYVKPSSLYISGNGTKNSPYQLFKTTTVKTNTPK